MKNDKAKQPAQGCEFCTHPLYAGTSCKNCGREKPAQQHIDHCLWARNGNQPCPHVHPANQVDGIDVVDIPAQQQKPVATVTAFGKSAGSGPKLEWLTGASVAVGDRLYTSPQPSKPWVGLTDAQIGAVAADIWGSVLIAPQSYQAFARAIEAKLREKNQ